MFFEEQIDKHKQKGSIEVICGSMFSGKTEELLRRIKRAEFAKLKISVFKPHVDIRYDSKKVVSHDSNTIISTTPSSFPSNSEKSTWASFASAAATITAAADLCIP